MKKSFERAQIEQALQNIVVKTKYVCARPMDEVEISRREKNIQRLFKITARRCARNLLDVKFYRRNKSALRYLRYELMTLGCAREIFVCEEDKKKGIKGGRTVFLLRAPDVTPPKIEYAELEIVLGSYIALPRNLAGDLYIPLANGVQLAFPLNFNALRNNLAGQILLNRLAHPDTNPARAVKAYNDMKHIIRLVGSNIFGHPNRNKRDDLSRGPKKVQMSRFCKKQTMNILSQH
jgi:hypothetical protein